MATMQTACRVCAGDLSLRVAGTNGHTPLADAFAPSRHETGRHGDLLACVECGTVQQPLLPAGDELHELYRDMSDDAYLGEEPGRRATAGAPARPHRRPGRRRAPARRRLRAWPAARRGALARLRDGRASSSRARRPRHAREALGLDVHEQPVESFVDLDGFDVVVLADVIEHLDDPVAAVDRCAGLLRPGGVLCVVTPDPSSVTARIAGRRWWGFVPAHACLLPRATLRELLSARGLVISADVPLVRSFSARRWVSGLAERLGRAGKPVERLADALPDGASLSLALHDERVILANRIDVRRAPEPLLRDRGGPAIVTLVLPAYEATRTIPEVAAEIPSTPPTARCSSTTPARTPPRRSRSPTASTSSATPQNRGYGGSQKTGYARALLDGADVIVMVHADNQYAPGLVPEMVAPILAGEADMVIGSRLLRDRAIAGGMPRWKWVGNRMLTGIENRAFGVQLSEYHTGYRAFSSDLLRSIPFLRNSDDFVFDQEIFAQVLARDARVVEIPIPTRYFREASSVDLGTSIRYGLMTLGVLARFTADRRRGRWPLLRRTAGDLGAQRR